MAELIDLPFGMWTVLDGMHIGATWQIQLNRPFVAPMWLYVKLL